MATNHVPIHVPGIAPGTSAAQILAFRDEHIKVPDGGQLDAQTLQAWALLTRAAAAASANDIALRLNDGDIEGVRAEVERLNQGLVDVSTDLSVLFAECEAAARHASVPPSFLVCIEKLREKYSIKDPGDSAKAAAAGAGAVRQPDGDPEDDGD